MGLIDSAEAPYSHGDLIRLSDPAKAEGLRYRIAETPQQVRKFVRLLADQIRQYGIPVLRGDRKVFARLASLREQGNAQAAEEMRVNRTRPQALEAFRAYRYAEAVQLFESICSNLTRSEVMKLEYARKKAKR
jgi:hypothetical protein